MKTDRVVWIIVAVFVLICLMGALMLRGQDQPIKFGLSEVEQLKRDNLWMQRQLTQCSITLDSLKMNDDVRRFVEETLKAHNNPAGVVWNPETYTFQVKSK